MQMRQLPNVPGVLAGLPERLAAPLFATGTRCEREAGVVLFSAGDPGDGCYRLEAGLVKVCVASPKGEERIVAILGPLAIVGELSMIDGISRSATVATLQDCV